MMGPMTATVMSAPSMLVPRLSAALGTPSPVLRVP
jgi:hypothetical protein